MSHDPYSAFGYVKVSRVENLRPVAKKHKTRILDRFTKLPNFIRINRSPYSISSSVLWDGKGSSSKARPLAQGE